MKKTLALILGIVLVSVCITFVFGYAPIFDGEDVTVDNGYSPVITEVKAKTKAELWPTTGDRLKVEAGYEAFKGEDDYIYYFDSEDKLAIVELKNLNYRSEYAMAIENGDAEPISKETAEKLAVNIARGVFKDKLEAFSKVDVAYDSRSHRYTVDFARDMSLPYKISTRGCSVYLRDDGSLISCSLTSSYSILAALTESEIEAAQSADLEEYVEEKVNERCEDVTSFEFDKVRLAERDGKLCLKATVMVKAPKIPAGEDVIKTLLAPKEGEDREFGLEIFYELD